MSHPSTLALLVAWAAGCAGPPPPAPLDKPPPPPPPVGRVTVTESGLRYEDLIEGTGETPRPGQTCRVHYTGTFEDGRTFDSSRNRGEPFEFSIGRGRVIQGWEEGVATMRVGGRRQLIIPPHLGYGERGVPGVIPPNAVLYFDVELLGIR